LEERSRVIDPQAVLVRGAELYQVANDTKSGTARKWQRLFFSSTGQQLDAYFAGGMCSFLPAYVMAPQQIATAWDPLPSRVTANDGKDVPGVPEGFQRLRCGVVEQIAQLIRELEPLDVPDDFNLIPIRRWPLVRFADGDVFPLFVPGIVQGLCEGIYDAVIGASIARRIPEDEGCIGNVFGKLFEQYVCGRLEECIGDRLLKSPRRSDTREEAADGILLCAEGIVLLQIKGCHIPAERRFVLKGRQGKEEDLAKTGLAKAVEQIVKSVSFCRRGLIPGLGFYGRPEDLTIQPVVVTYEHLPSLGVRQSFVEEQRALARVDDHTRPLVLADIGELEELCALRDGESVWSVLSEFLPEIRGGHTSLHNFLVRWNKVARDHIVTRSKAMQERLKARLFERPDGGPGS